MSPFMRSLFDTIIIPSFDFKWRPITALTMMEIRENLNNNSLSARFLLFFFHESILPIFFYLFFLQSNAIQP